MGGPSEDSQLDNLGEVPLIADPGRWTRLPSSHDGLGLHLKLVLSKRLCCGEGSAPCVFRLALFEVPFCEQPLTTGIAAVRIGSGRKEK